MYAYQSKRRLWPPIYRNNNLVIVDKLQVTGVSSGQQREMIKAWLSHHRSC
jgi:hypothetical protein